MRVHSNRGGKPVTVTILGSADAFSSGGRIQAGCLVESGGRRFMLEAGPGLLGALKGRGVSPATLDFVIISHLHGDHFAGLPFLLLEYMYENPPRKTVVIAGPPRLEQRTWTLLRTMYPRFDLDAVRNKVKFVVVEPGKRIRLGTAGLLEAIRSPHMTYDLSLSIRLETGGKTIVFSGDTGWNEELIDFSKGADLMICECTFYEPNGSYSHINYRELKRNIDRFQVGRMVLTHLGSDVLRRESDVELEMAFDGMKFEL